MIKNSTATTSPALRQGDEEHHAINGCDRPIGTQHGSAVLDAEGRLIELGNALGAKPLADGLAGVGHHHFALTGLEGIAQQNHRALIDFAHNDSTNR